MKLVLLLAFAFLTASALAWDAAGHMLVGQIAWENTRPDARKRVEELVATLEKTFNEDRPYHFVTAGCWMDDMRSKKGYQWSKWHYVTIPWTADGVAFELPPSPHVVSAIDENLKTLRSPESKPQDAAIALAMLFHFVGDVHQPMHTTDRGDRGGNGVMVAGIPFTDLWPGTVPNLHAYWDAAYRFDVKEGKVIEAWECPAVLVRPRAPGEGVVATEAARIIAQFPMKNYADRLASDATSWARESHTLGCVAGYPPNAEATDYSVVRIEPEFVAKSRPLANERVALAGYRLAKILNELFAHVAAASADVKWLPSGLPAPPAEGPALCRGGYLQPEQGQAVLDAALAEFPDRASWERYGQHARKQIQQGLGLDPWPRLTALNPIIRARRVYDGYTVENVAFESVPGYFVTGNLYRPLDAKPPFPVVLSTHGHSKKIEKPEDYEKHGRFHPGMQARCAALARMGAVVFSIDMFGYGDSIQQVGPDAHARPFSLTIQMWNARRALDFLLSLEGVDPKNVAVSGESGGGTQAFLLTALDPRITVSVPVVMVSSYFFGGCPCESGLPIHRSADHFVNNAMIAALAAPRPMLVVSDGKDWTKNVPQIEYPFLQRIYGYYGAEKNVANVHLPDEGHDYGPSKRAAMYRFVADRLGLDLGVIEDVDAKIDETRATIEKPDALRVFNPEFPLPAHALRDAAGVERALRELQQ